jgi:hypothetical protein
VRLARARELDNELCRLHQRSKQEEAAMARKLVELDDEGGYLDLGFGSLPAYAEDRFEWGPSKTRDMKKLVRRLEELPLVATAFFEGDLDWTKAVLAARALEGAPEQEAEWLAKATSRTSKELAHEVAEAKGEERQVRVGWKFLAKDLAMIEEAFRALQSEGLVLTGPEAVVELARRQLQGQSGKAGSSSFRVLLTHDPDTGVTTKATRAGEVVLDPKVADRLMCGAEIQLPSGEVKRSIPAWTERQLEARSKGRCEVPSCKHVAWLESHHNEGWRAGHHVDLMVRLCSAHHAALHAGALRIEGSWSEGFCFLLADGTVLGTVGGAGATKGARAARPREARAEDASGFAREAEPTAEGEAPVAHATSGASGALAEGEAPVAHATSGALAEGEAPVAHAPRGGLAQGEAPVARATRRTLAEGELPVAREPTKERRRRTGFGASGRRGRGPLTEVEAAIAGLRVLELSAREARELVQRVLEQRPELSEDASELVRQALILYSPRRGRRS